MRLKRTRELIEQQGCCGLVHLPAYSPDHNPIEEAFAKIKHPFRKTIARSKDALVEEIGVALGAIPAEDAGASSSMLESGGPEVIGGTPVNRMPLAHYCKRHGHDFVLLTTRVPPRGRGERLVQSHAQ